MTRPERQSRVINHRAYREQHDKIFGKPKPCSPFGPCPTKGGRHIWAVRSKGIFRVIYCEVCGEVKEAKTTDPKEPDHESK